MRRLVFAAFLAFCCAAHAAPAPLPKAPRPLRLTGQWQMTWAGGQYHTILTPDGRYSAASGRNVWSGWWTLSGRTLSVREWLDGGDCELAWEVELDAALAGRTRSGVDVKLQPLK